jgi:hypothetical protein
MPLAGPPGAFYVRVVAGQASPIDLDARREKRVASELERLAAAQRVHDRIQTRLREARRLEFERASRSGLSEQQIAEAAGVPLEHVRQVLGG